MLSWLTRVLIHFMLDLALYQPQEGMARKPDDFTTTFRVHRKDFLNMEKRCLARLVGQPYYNSLCRPVEARDELGRIMDALCIGNAETSRRLRNLSAGLILKLKGHGTLDGRSPLSVVAAAISLTAKAVNIPINKKALEQACYILPSTVSQVSALVQAEGGVQQYLAQCCEKKTTKRRRML